MPQMKTPPGNPGRFNSQDVKIEFHCMRIDRNVASKHICNRQISIISLLGIDDCNQTNAWEETHILNCVEHAAVDKRSIKNDNSN